MKIAFKDLEIGMKFRARGERGKIYKIVGLSAGAGVGRVTLKRESDGLIYRYGANHFMKIVGGSVLTK